ncbi:CD209 antigen-like [Anabas testudineus]|nr:CD209 antigen-like [Anabas testudineus]
MVMSLKLEIEGVMVNVVSGYAPQVGCELEEKERFWSVKIKEGSLSVSHSSATQIVTELKYLRSNYSNVTEAGEELKKDLETAIKRHKQLKGWIFNLVTSFSGKVQEEANQPVGSNCSTAMEKVSFMRNAPQVFFNRAGHSQSRYKIFGKDVYGSNRCVLLCLGLLNVVLLIAAVSLGVKCTKVKESSIHVTHSSATQLINELKHLHDNHSDVIEAGEKLKKTLETAIKNHTLLKEQIEQKKSINDENQRQVETLRTEKTNLQANISALEGTCGKCLPGWNILNSSCYFFSYLESSTVKKNWADSRADCVRRGADLVVIDNQEEQKFVSDSIQNMKTTTNRWGNGFWIGITDVHSEGTWTWINNVTMLDRRYWMDGEPNNRGQKEDCGVILYSSISPWKTMFDGPCHYPYHWVCKMDSR